MGQRSQVHRRHGLCLVVLVGLFLLGGCAERPTDSTTKASPISSFADHFSLNLTGSGITAIPIVTRQRTEVSGAYDLSGDTPNFFEIDYIELGKTPPTFLYVNNNVDIVKFSSSKRINDQTGLYEEKCLDGTTRQHRGDPACKMESRVLGPVPEKKFETPYASIPAGKGYLIVSQWRPSLALQFQLSEPAFVGEPLRLSSSAEAFAPESFDARFMDISRCFGEFSCGTIYEGRLPLSLNSSQPTFVNTWVSASTGAYLDYCLRVGSETATCAPESSDTALRSARTITRLLPEGAQNADLELVVITSPNPTGQPTPSVASNFFMIGFYAPMPLPPAFPLDE